MDGAGAGSGGASGADCTAATGAREGGAATSGTGGGAGGAGGASAAGMVALAVPGGGGGGGGGAVPRPNKPGEALGDDGSGIGAAAATRWALVRSATSALAMLASAARSGGVGLGGTLARFG
ncbi:MAG: hypothetical protein WDN25_28565 [Acetobacteraceae bacterium]